MGLKVNDEIDEDISLVPFPTMMPVGYTSPPPPPQPPNFLRAPDVHALK